MTTTPPGSISWTFLAPGCPRPTGGDIARFEIVNAIARAGRDHVRVVHVPTAEQWIRDLSDLPWFAFDPAVEHQFAADLDPDGVPDSDVVVYSTKLLATALETDVRDVGRRLVDELQANRSRAWLPILLLQGHGVFPPAMEELAFRLPGPKVCVGSWFRELLERHGVPADDIVHIPNGIDPGIFHTTRPIEHRPPAVAMNFDPHPAKRGPAGMHALQALQRQHGVPGTMFGTIPVDRPIPAGLRFVASPSQATLADEIYNGASLFLQPSRQEGFGLCAVEAMACGCALVTTANGGSADYAFDGETALVCEAKPLPMAEALGRLVLDDALRIRIATNGARFVERFRWTTSADRLALLAAERLAEPSRHRSADSVDLDAVLSRLRR